MLFEMTLPGIKKIKAQGNCAFYEMEPLEPGYGTTIAHALKRVLRSSLPGAAVTAIRIEGVPQECQSIPGVREEVTDIVLNIKQVRLHCVADHPVFMHLDVSGKRKVTAADIVAPDTVEIINPQCHIAHLNHEDTHLLLEFAVQVGKGYIPTDAQTELLDGFTPIDAIYSPVRKADYTIEHTRVGKMVNFDSILLQIETDGTLTPDEALRQSGEILLQQFLVFTATPVPIPEREASSDSSAVPIPASVYNLSLHALKLPVRILNSFTRKGITTAGQLLMMSEEDFRGIRNIGEKSIPVLVEKLRAAGCFP